MNNDEIKTDFDSRFHIKTDLEEKKEKVCLNCPVCSQEFSYTKSKYHEEYSSNQHYLSTQQGGQTIIETRQSIIPSTVRTITTNSQKINQGYQVCQNPGCAICLRSQGIYSSQLIQQQTPVVYQQQQQASVVYQQPVTTYQTVQQVVPTTSYQTVQYVQPVQQQQTIQYIQAPTETIRYSYVQQPQIEIQKKNTEIDYFRLKENMSPCIVCGECQFGHGQYEHNQFEHHKVETHHHHQEFNNNPLELQSQMHSKFEVKETKINDLEQIQQTQDHFWAKYNQNLENPKEEKKY